MYVCEEEVANDIGDISLGTLEYNNPSITATPYIERPIIICDRPRGKGP